MKDGTTQHTLVAGPYGCTFPDSRQPQIDFKATIQSNAPVLFNFLRHLGGAAVNDFGVYDLPVQSAPAPKAPKIGLAIVLCK